MNSPSFARAYTPRHDENRMHGEGDSIAARKHFLANRPRNLANLLEQRYTWMGEWIGPRETAIELGSGHGLIHEFIKDRKIILTDVSEADFIEMKVDALNLPFLPNSVDVFICSHMIHHVAQPLTFLRLLHRSLKPNGLLIIQEINTSLMMRLILRLTRHEGWSYDVDVFDEKAVCNDANDPWSANCAIANMLFSDAAAFERAMPEFKIELNKQCECFAFPLSGGVIAKSKTVQLPWSLLRAVNAIDRLLTRWLPGIFALGRSVVLRKMPAENS